MSNFYTGKEVILLSDMLALEEHACKKARLYARTLTNMELAKQFTEIADMHEKRFNEILESL